MADTIRVHNPEMVIISDTVYASFVDEFNTFGKKLPENILGVYSFSKYFGVTGWRLGVVMIHENCVVERIIRRLPKKQQAMLDIRYRLPDWIEGLEPELRGILKEKGFKNVVNLKGGIDEWAEKFDPELARY